ncbi:MAG: hypothetical protein AAFY07_03285 [Pseudomonadota bacterium]
MASGSLQFINIARERLSQPAFLADAAGEAGIESAAIPVAQMTGGESEIAPIHFVFHTAFCRSTLLVRALEQPGICSGLSEPGILANLAGAHLANARNPAPGAAAAAAAQGEMLTGIVRLLARPWGAGEAVVIKPTNHANVLIPALMDTAPKARAVMVTNALPSFLAAVARKGMMGRRWGRLLYLEMMSYAGMDLGMDGREQFAMTDLQACALAWFLNQRYFAALQDKFGDRVRVLDGDRFADHASQTLVAVSELMNLAITGEMADAIEQSAVFSRDAKTGEDFAEKSARDAAASHSAVVEDEVAKVTEWIGMIAQRAGLDIPVRHNLF